MMEPRSCTRLRSTREPTARRGKSLSLPLFSKALIASTPELGRTDFIRGHDWQELGFLDGLFDGLFDGGLSTRPFVDRARFAAQLDVGGRRDREVPRRGTFG